MPAAGAGRRLGGGAKALVRLDGRAMLAHAVEAMEANHCTTAVVVVSHPDTLEATAKLLADEGLAKVTALVAGGPTRQASVAAGLRALPSEPRYVVVHDAARPLVAPGMIDRMLELLLEAGLAGVVPGVPVIDTIRRVDAAQRSTGIVDREQLRSMQTPQLFVREVLEGAYRLALRDGVEATDEAALVELAGHSVQVVPGDPENLKVTTPLDLAIAETLLARRRGSGAAGPGDLVTLPPLRVGQGVDAHPLVAGRPLVLGGVTVPFELGLDGHSDADVVAHAACDAVLGAAGLPDLGHHFPSADPRWEGVSSIDLCARVAELVAASGWAPVNLDVAVLCDRPRLGHLTAAMAANLAAALGLEPARVRVTAKATDGLGFSGRGEGIAASAVCLAAEQPVRG